MNRAYTTHRCPTCGHTVRVRVNATITCPRPGRAITRPDLMRPVDKLGGAKR